MRNPSTTPTQQDADGFTHCGRIVRRFENQGGRIRKSADRPSGVSRSHAGRADGAGGVRERNLALISGDGVIPIKIPDSHGKGVAGIYLIGHSEVLPDVLPQLHAQVIRAGGGKTGDVFYIISPSSGPCRPDVVAIIHRCQRAHLKRRIHHRDGRGE